MKIQTIRFEESVYYIHIEHLINVAISCKRLKNDENRSFLRFSVRSSAVERESVNI